jgi:hypothetical protein
MAAFGPLDRRGFTMAARLRLRNVLYAAAVAATLGVTGCSHHSTPTGASTGATVATGAQLRDKLLTGTTLPAGLRIILDPAIGDSRPPRSADADPCAGVINAYSLVEAADTPVAWARVSVAANDGPRWMAGEALSSHKPGGAAQVLAAIRALANKCSTIAGPLTTHISIADGPRLGDESLRVKARTSATTVPGAEIEADAIVIRAGDVLLVVDELNTMEAPGVSRLDEVAAAAYAKLAGA